MNKTYRELFVSYVKGNWRIWFSETLPIWLMAIVVIDSPFFNAYITTWYWGLLYGFVGILPLCYVLVLRDKLDKKYLLPPQDKYSKN